MYKSVFLKYLIKISYSSHHMQLINSQQQILKAYQGRLVKPFYRNLQNDKKMLPNSMSSFKITSFCVKSGSC